MTWNALIALAFESANVIQPGESISGLSYETNGQTRLNMLISSLSTEKLTAYQQVQQTFNLVAGTGGYTLGSGGSFATTGALRAQRVTAWRASYGGVLSSGGRPLSMDEFGAQAKQLLGEVTPIPAIVGADTAFPLINVRVFPTPSATPGTLELSYFTPITQISDFTATPTLPEGWLHMLHLQLAIIIYNLYPRQGGMPPELAANAQNAKAAVVGQNAMGSQPGGAA